MLSTFPAYWLRPRAYFTSLVVWAMVGSAFAQTPTLTTPTVSQSQIGANQITVTVQSSATGTGYLTLLVGDTTATPSTGAQVAAATDHAAAAAFRSGSLPLNAGVAATYTFGNLAENTGYTVWFTADDGVPANLQSVARAVFTTTTSAANETGKDWGAIGYPDLAGGSVGWMSMAIAPDGTPYVAYVDDILDSEKVTVRKFDGTSWTVVGAPRFSSGAAETSIAFAPDGTLYVAIKNNAAYNVTVWKLGDGAWSTVGTPGFSAINVYDVSLAVAPDGTPYVAYRLSTGKATLMKFDTSLPTPTWGEVGGAPGGFSAGAARYTSLAFAPDGTPWVAYRDDDLSASGGATVMRFDGTLNSWNLVGARNFSGSPVEDVSLTFAPDGTPHVAFRDGSGGATVMRFDSGSWALVGDRRFSGNDVSYTSLAFAPDGTPFVAYTDLGADGMAGDATVMKLDGADWAQVGSAGLSVFPTGRISLRFAPDGAPYVGSVSMANYGQLVTVVKLEPPPTLTPPSIEAGANQATITFQSSGTGTGYFTLLRGAGAVPGDAGQTASGQGGADDAFRFGSLPLRAGTPGAYTIRNLEPNTTYKLCFTAGNGAALQPNVQVIDFTTPPGADVDGMDWEPVGTAGLVGSSLFQPSLAVAPDGTPYVAYVDSGSGRVTVKKLVGDSWTLVGSAACSDGSAADPALAFGPDGAPYVVYSDSYLGCPGYATMKKLVGSSWSPIGTLFFSQCTALNPSLAFALDGAPYVAFGDGNSDGKATVMKLSGGWQLVGSAHLSADAANRISLAFTLDGIPCIAFMDRAAGDKATVMKFDGSGLTGWSVVGSNGTGLSEGTAGYTSLAFAPNGMRYLAYQDGGDPDAGATVMKFGDTLAWTSVGSVGFSDGAVAFTSLAVAPDGANGTPFVLFKDGARGGKTTVMKLNSNGSLWDEIGTPGFSSNEAEPGGIVFAPNGTPYVAYRDTTNNNVIVMNLAMDTVAPAAPPTPATGSNPTTNRRPAITGTAEPGSTVRLYDGLTLVASVTAAAGTGNWSITPSSDLSLGTHALRITATDTAGNVSAASAVLTLTVEEPPSPPSQDSQTIVFGLLANKLTTDAPFTVAATANSGLAVRFSLVSGPAIISGSRVTLTGMPGVVTIRATQSGNSDYEAAAPVERSFRVKAAPPQLSRPPVSDTAVVLSAGCTAPGCTYQWQCNGSDLGGPTGPTLTLANCHVASGGLYTYTMVTPDGAAHTSDPVVVGLSIAGKIEGGAEEVLADVLHPNGNIYDQLLLDESAAALTANTGQITRISFIDLSDDIVQVEFSGAGTLSLVVDGVTTPVPAANYNQPGVNYVRGHAGIVITGANETTNVSVFSVGRITAVNQTLFRDDVTYDGVANIAFIAIQSTNGKFGGVRTGNVEYFASRGFTGLYAPGVAFAGPINIGDIQAHDDGQPLLVLGAASEVRIAGGSLLQPNGQPIRVDGLTRVTMAPGQTSQGNVLPAQTTQCVLEQDGVDVTDLLVAGR
jgi:hypothetical protein